MPEHVVVDNWKTTHYVKSKNKFQYTFYCGRRAKIKRCKDATSERSCCSSCFAIVNLGPVCVNREIDEVDVQSIVRCPREVSETGLIKIVGDQTQCSPNSLQLGTRNWDYLAIMYDPDHPHEIRSYFEVSIKELEKWRNLYE